MCKFCEKWHDKNTIFGDDIKIHECANETNLTYAMILKDTGYDKPAIVILQIQWLWDISILSLSHVW